MIDTHIHLDDARYDGQREQIIEGLAADGVQCVINTSAEYDGMLVGVELARRYERVFCTLGCHPHDSATYDDKFEAKITELSSFNKVVAIGEIGLDYFYDLSDRATQREVFQRQIVLADKLKLPITLHIRDAYGDMLDILSQCRSYVKHGLLLHCYSGSGETAKVLLDKYDAYFAFGGALTFKKNRKAEVLGYIPLDKILTETDGPYLTPEPFRGKLNYPKYISLLLPILANCYQVSEQEVERQTVANAIKFFNLQL